MDHGKSASAESRKPGAATKVTVPKRPSIRARQGGGASAAAPGPLPPGSALAARPASGPGKMRTPTSSAVQRCHYATARSVSETPGQAVALTERGIPEATPVSLQPPVCGLRLPVGPGVLEDVLFPGRTHHDDGRGVDVIDPRCRTALTSDQRPDPVRDGPMPARARGHSHAQIVNGAAVPCRACWSLPRGPSP